MARRSRDHGPVRGLFFMAYDVCTATVARGDDAQYSFPQEAQLGWLVCLLSNGRLSQLAFRIAWPRVRVRVDAMHMHVVGNKT